MLEHPKTLMTEVLNNKRYYNGQSAGKTEMNLKRAYLLGYHLGDGCLTIGSRGRMAAQYEGIDLDVIQVCREIIAEEFGSFVALQQVEKKNTWRIATQNDSVCQWLKDMVGREKTWPKEVDFCAIDCMKGFLAGLMD